MITTMNGDLLESNELYIAHQCNCVSTGAGGLAKYLFKKYPYSDEYSSRTSPSTPGTISICGNGKDQRYIINMFAQYYPSNAFYQNDTSELRLQWFKECLEQIKSAVGETYVGFPYMIGCGLAGGNWDDYLAALENSGLNIHIYKL